ncbi:MAG: hypothetical protein ACRD2H_06345 [Terriglobales bacterium]
MEWRDEFADRDAATAAPSEGDEAAISDAVAAGNQPGAAEQAGSEAPYVGPDPPREVQEALRALVRGYELESDAVRRHKVRLWRQAEEFWKGNQNIWWNAGTGQWQTPFERPLGDPDDAPRCDYSINLYRAWGLSVIAALTMSKPTIQFRPASAANEADIATASAADKIQALVAHNNPLDTLRTKKAYYLWTQGIYAAYVRFVVDGGLYGYSEVPQFEERAVELAPARWECEQCGGMQPAEAGAAPALRCAGCGAPLGAESYRPPERMTAPVATDTRRVANGAEKIDVYGPLFFKVPPQAEDQRHCYYLILAEEQHKATLRAAYPGKADVIDDVGSGAEDTYERIVRLSLADAQGSWNSLPLSSLVTYKRAWLRPEAFWAHADSAMRRELLTLYPEGCCVEFAGDAFLTARPERMDDYWVICTGLPGIGLYRDGLGYDALSIQRQINDSANILAEHREMSSAPPILYDARYINGEALTKKRMQPASYMPVVIENAGLQKQLSELVFQPRLGVDPALWQDGERLAEVGQVICGALPSIFGGGSPNLKTASAYAQAREQAMGRLTLTLRQMWEAEARERKLAVECFKRNRDTDTELVIAGVSGAYRSEFIRLSELRGSAVAYAAAAEDFPQSWAQVRESLQQLLQSKDPVLLDILGAPENRPILKRYLGLPELVDPAEDNRSKQYRETEALLESEPTAGPAGRLRPSIVPDPLVDDHDIHIDAIKEWAVSDIGIAAKAARPLGYANVIAHLLAHMDAEENAAADQARRSSAVIAAGQEGSTRNDA